jgi:ribosomal subunit interface protein
VDIIFKGRHTDVQERFRERATAKLSRIAKLDQKAIRIDVEVTAERNPRQADRRERVELTITSRGPAIRAEAAGQDRYAALDMALAKLESRLRRAGDRRKARRAGSPVGRPGDPTIDETTVGTAPAFPAAAGQPAAPGGAQMPTVPRQAIGERLARAGTAAAGSDAARPGDSRSASPDDGLRHEADDVVPIEMEGDGPLVVREKFHLARPMAIDQALFEMELVGHDFFLFRDAQDGCPSVVYRRRGYQYGVIRLVEELAAGRADGSSQQAMAPRSNGQQAGRTTDVASG